MNTRQRVKNMQTYMKKEGIGLSIVMFPENQYYFSGFKATIYSRPIILLIDLEAIRIVVPQMEKAHVRHDAGNNIDEIIVYYEKVQDAHKGINPYEKVYEVLSKIPKTMKVGLEFNNITYGFAHSVVGKGYVAVDIAKEIGHIRAYKDAEEIELLNGASRLVEVAMTSSLKGIRPGMTELELEKIGNDKMMEFSNTYSNCTVDSFVMTPSGIDRTIKPHVFSNTRQFLEKDIIIHTRKIALNGYFSELERTVFLGEPTKEQKRAFAAMKDAQYAALEYIKPGVKAKDVDILARKILAKAGYEEYIVHRTGHGIGIGRHEEPYLRFDNDFVLENKMVFTIEPGIYIPEVGGFRHSDTLVLDNGTAEIITNYPREIEDLIFCV